MHLNQCQLGIPAWKVSIARRTEKGMARVPGRKAGQELASAALEDVLAEESPQARLQGADLAFRTKPAWQGPHMLVPAAMC